MFVNDELVINLDDLGIRDGENVKIHGLYYNTYFNEKPDKDEKAFFKNFEMGEFSDSTEPSRIDVDECRIPELSLCHHRADCSNFAGGFDCTCHEGLSLLLPTQRFRPKK